MTAHNRQSDLKYELFRLIVTNNGISPAVQTQHLGCMLHLLYCTSAAEQGFRHTDRLLLGTSASILRPAVAEHRGRAQYCVSTKLCVRALRLPRRLHQAEHVGQNAPAVWKEAWGSAGQTLPSTWRWLGHSMPDSITIRPCSSNCCTICTSTHGTCRPVACICGSLSVCSIVRCCTVVPSTGVAHFWQGLARHTITSCPGRRPRHAHGATANVRDDHWAITDR